MAERRVPGTHKHARNGPAGDSPIHFRATSHPPFLASRALLVDWERELILEIARGAVRPDCRVPHQWESEEVESSTPPTSAMSSVVVADGRRRKEV